MNTTLRTLVTALTLGLPLYVSADSASINYRHQFTEEDSAHADRIKLNYRLDSGLGFEAVEHALPLVVDFKQGQQAIALVSKVSTCPGSMPWVEPMLMATTWFWPATATLEEP